MTPSSRPNRPLNTIKVTARNEDFRIVQLSGNLFVCSKAHGSCCCGWEEKGRGPVNEALYEAEWQRRKLRNTLHLTFAGCLGPCAVGNNALLTLFGQSFWFKDLNTPEVIGHIFDYIEAMVNAGQVLAPPPTLHDHWYARYLPAPADAPHYAAPQEMAGGLERLDPVCLMDVDPETARFTSEYAGRTYYFCAPGCKRAFDRKPSAYLVDDRPAI